jgi:hypothetical protein
MFRVTPLALTVILAASTASAQPSDNNELAPECRAVLQQRSE